MRFEKSFLLSLVTMFSLFDVITTYIGISRGLTEENIFLSSLPGNLMFIVMTILKISVILLSYILLKKGYILPVIIVAIIMGFVVLNNLFLLI
ncbi:DUF5658 family protein [Sulfurisphaera javensis]|uniref:DUF5658 family protein n=1 Tax=Sulfurisphaera javensis TaxID=2049879 RepID=A0AAT9GPK9_9CREN